MNWESFSINGRTNRCSGVYSECCSPSSLSLTAFRNQIQGPWVGQNGIKMQLVAYTPDRRINKTCPSFVVRLALLLLCFEQVLKSKGKRMVQMSWVRTFSLTTPNTKISQPIFRGHLHCQADWTFGSFRNFLQQVRHSRIQYDTVVLFQCSAIIFKTSNLLFAFS